MKTKFTKGEWFWDGNPSDYDPSEEAPWLITDDKQIIKGEIKVENIYDAKLIAAAPDLFDVLTKIQKCFSSFDSNGNAVLRIPIDLNREINNVLKKATE